MKEGYQNLSAYLSLKIFEGYEVFSINGTVFIFSIHNPCDNIFPMQLCCHFGRTFHLVLF